MNGAVSSGIRRKIDDLGRVVIPAGIRRSLNIREGDAVEVTVEGERIVLSRPRDACVFCGREDDALQTFRNRWVCTHCVSELGRADDRRRAAEGMTEPTDGVPVPDPIPPAPPTPTPEPEPDPDPLPAPGPTPEPEPVPARTPAARQAAPVGATLGQGPIDGDALGRAEHHARTRRRERPQAQPVEPASTTAW